MIAALFLPLLLQASTPTEEVITAVLEAAEQGGNPDWNCENPMAQQEMNWCAGQDLEVAENEAADQWQDTLAVLKAQDAEEIDSGGFETDVRVFKLMQSQVGWSTYVDAHCALEGFAARGGSLEPLLVATCRARLARQRTAELKSLIETEG